MNEQKHIINRQVLELTIPERGRAQSIQNKTSDVVKRRLLPALDKLFSKISVTNEIIRIDKLIIDLGTIQENELENVFVEKTVKEISDKIDRLKISGSLKTAKSHLNGNSSETAEKFLSTSKIKDMLGQFVYFLQTGHFPWWNKSSGKLALPGRKVSSGTAYFEEIFNQVLKCESEVLKNAIFPLLRNPFVRQRLIFQFNHSQIYSLLERINYQLIKSYLALFQTLFSLIKSTQKRKEITGHFYEIALQYFSVELGLTNDDLKIGFIKDILKLNIAKQSESEKELILVDLIHILQQLQSQESYPDENLTFIAIIQVALELPTHNKHVLEIIQNSRSENGKVINDLIKQYNKLTDKETVKKEKVANTGIKKRDKKNSGRRDGKSAGKYFC